MFLKKRRRDPANIEEIVSAFEKMSKRVESIEKEIEEMKRENRLHLQRVGVVRFNPFPNMGGNQSFSLALLNKDSDGVVVTSFYSQEGSSVYGKLIRGGESEHPLVKEEKEAISIATNGKISKEKDNGRKREK